MKRRHDLIPNPAATAEKYIRHEHETLEAVIKARNQASSANRNVVTNLGDPDAMKNLIGTETAFTGAMGRLFALAESYPERRM